MPLIDEQGRVLGRLNLVDAAAVLFLLVLLPGAYLSYRLFRDPPAKLTAVNPARLRTDGVQQIEVRGENLRPYMRVSFNDVQGRTFLFYSPTSAFVQVPDLPPGTYDIVLYDYLQAVSRLPAAFTVDAPPPPATIVVDVSGWLSPLTADQVPLLVAGFQLTESGAPVAQVLSAGP